MNLSIKMTDKEILEIERKALMYRIEDGRLGLVITKTHIELLIKKYFRN